MIGTGGVTLIEGASFCVSTQNGDILPGTAQGIYYADTRALSRWQLKIDDGPVEALQVLTAEPYHATFIGRACPYPGRSESTLLVKRDRYVGSGMREDLVLSNLAGVGTEVTLVVRLDSDLADPGDVKTARLPRADETEWRTTAPGELVIMSRTRPRGVRISAPGAQAEAGSLTFRVRLAPRSSWTTTIQIHPVIDEVEAPSRFPSKQPLDEAEPARRLADWRRHSPTVKTPHDGLAAALRNSLRDLGALRLFDRAHPEDPPSIAAGAPWSMTLFGRDSLITSWMALPLDQSLALGTLRRLARLQGQKVDPATGEEPGKILHELRSGVRSGGAYYGSVDSTPLFVMLLGELRRWGLHPREVDDLLPHADRAVAWIEEYGDVDGDGFVEYAPGTEQDGVSQGWKDQFDAITFADGRIARAPIVLAEVQGYVYAAYMAYSHFNRENGNPARAAKYRMKAMRLKQRFNQEFWLPDQKMFAIGLDRDKRPIDGLASNMGQCLWTGIVDFDKADAVAERLMSPEMFSGFGVRTLATTMAAYNPMSYHNGSIWPHDNALIASGLMRYGFAAQAQRIAMGLLDATTAFDGRVPELFCGFDRTEYPSPVPYPTSCIPQAWAAAVPIQLLRVLLRFDPWVPYGKVWASPALPSALGDLTISQVPLGGARIDLVVRGGELRIRGLPKGFELIAEPRYPLAAEDQPAPLNPHL
ncbi:amylo-alpha-1,6-glucosidase [Rhizohabitans arisaemae]|uniref:amylo-alpha-1,6-glucosidase n=1 Tax=Rhizohabitans arisaemae TaxID=2720610 RepID=UPI0024B23E9E|nr:glycogen debranching N-terminal domain-containing protein [Rhizohabitans arisaemae]